MHLQASEEDQRVPAKQNKKLTFQEYVYELQAARPCVPRFRLQEMLL